MERKRELKHFRDLDVYQKVFGTAMRIYQITKTFPIEEKSPSIQAPTDHLVKESQRIAPDMLYPGLSGLSKAEMAFYEFRAGLGETQRADIN